jgi:RNA polymerase sigma-70 factor, ECF subfamily
LKDIFLKHHSDLCRVAFRIVADAEKSKDIVQDVFLKLWIKRTDLEISISLQAYLRRAVVNTALNTLKELRHATLPENDVTSLQRSSGNLVEETHFKELAAVAEGAIESLPPRTKAVFRLIREEEMSYREVSAALEISEKAVEKEMMKALKLLRIQLRDYLPVMLFLGIFWE